MTAVLQKWGNSQGVRLPKKELRWAAFKSGRSAGDCARAGKEKIQYHRTGGENPG